MKQLYFKIYFFSILFYLFGCVEDPEMSTKLQNASRPEVGNMEVVDSTATTLRVKAVVKSENGAPLTARGFRYWKEGEQKDFQEVKDTEKLGLGEYIKVIENLKNGAIYEITPFASNEVGTAFGDTISLNTTKGVGEVKTSDILEENITATTARVEGILVKKGEGEITDFGFELYIGGVKDTTFRKSDGVEWGDNDSTFYYVIAGLTQETKYEVKAFAENSFGPFSHVSGKKKFTTKNGRPVLPASIDVDTDYDFILLKSKLISKGDVEYKDVEVGFCWGTVAGIDRPNIETEDDRHAACPLESDSFKLVLDDLDDSSYYIRAYAKNKFGTVYSEDSILVAKKRDTPIVYLGDADTYTVKDGLVTISGKVQDKGKSDVTSLMLYYSTSNPLPGPNDGKYVECLNYLEKDGKFTIPLKLLGGHKYYFRVYAKNASGGAYGENVQSVATPDVFIRKASFTGKGRQNFITFSLDNYAFVLGGRIGNEYTDDLYGYSLSSGSWTPLLSYKWNIEGGSVCSDGNSVYVMGGKYASTNIEEVYSYSYNRWTSHPEMRIRKDMVGTLNAISFAHKNSIVMMGGEKTLPNDNRGMIVQDSIYHWDGEMWNVAGTFPALIKGGVALTTGDSVIAGLGSISQDSINSTTNRQLWINTSGEWNNWESLPEAPAKMEMVSTGVVKGSRLYFIDIKGIIWMYDLTESKWYECSQSPVLPDQPEYRIMMINEDIYILALNNFGISSFVIYDPTWDIAKGIE